jgi:cytochrome d ubiquinol oxidase subunit II
MIAAIWFSIIVLCLVMYVVLDGYDLGIGINLLFERDPRKRREMVELVATAWDGNESWIILLGVSLWAGFPAAFGVILPYVYIPMIVTLFALVVRGVSVESISGASSLRTPWWMGLFTAGSLIAAFGQGLVIGALMEDVRTVDGAYAGSAMDFLTPFSVLTGLALVLLYATLGAAFVRLKGEGAIRDINARRGRVLLGFAITVSVITALSINATGAPLTLDTPLKLTLFIILASVAALAAIIAFVVFPRPDRKPSRESLPFAAVTTATVAGLLAFVVGRYPVLVPPDLTVQSAQSPAGTLNFLIYAVGANIPLLLFYNWYAHHVFRGKYRQDPSVRSAGASSAAYALTAKGKTRG